MDCSEYCVREPFYIDLNQHFWKILIPSISFAIKKSSVTKNYWSFFKFFQLSGDAQHNLLKIELKLHEGDLKQLDLPGLKLGEVESETSSSNDGGSLGYNEDWGCDSFEGVIDAVDSLALSPASNWVNMYGPPVSRILIDW